MKNYILVGVASLLVALGQARGEMTAEQFKKLVETPGDTKPLRTELAKLPFWRNATLTLDIKYQDGRTFNETMPETVKTIEGTYVVFEVESKSAKQRMHSIVGYDDKAHAIKQWGLSGETVTESTMVFDFAKKINASTSRYADGMMEVGVASFSDTGMSGRAEAFKEGVLFFTREVSVKPARARRCRFGG